MKNFLFSLMSKSNMSILKISVFISAIPLFTYRSVPSERKWLKLPGAAKKSTSTEKF